MESVIQKIKTEISNSEKKLKACRKYDKNGILLVSASLPTGANGYSGKLVHK
jgi:hypothetical protein